MQYETLHGISIPKLGFGTWRIGGETQPNADWDSRSMTALHTALETGYSHFDTAEYYAAGHCEELVGRAVREAGIDRGKLFITSKVSPEHLEPNEVLRSCENSLRRLGMEYIDLYLIHWPSAGMRLERTFPALNKLVRDGKVRRLGVSNFKLKLLKQSQELSETPLLTNQVPYSLADRSYVDNGVVEYCQQHNILVTAYSPVKFRSIRVNKILAEISAAHGLTPFQAALAWLALQPRVITIPMSFNPQHIRENFEAGRVQLSADEIQRLDHAWDKNNG